MSSEEWEAAIFSERTTMTEERSEQNTKQESQNMLLEILADKMLLHVQQNCRIRREGFRQVVAIQGSWW